MKKYLIILLLFFFAVLACQKNSRNQGPMEQQVVDKAIAFHGMEQLNNSSFSLTFREMDYTYTMKDGRYKYTRTQTDSLGREVVDILTNEGHFQKLLT